MELRTLCLLLGVLLVQHASVQAAREKDQSIVKMWVERQEESLDAMLESEALLPMMPLESRVNRKPPSQEPHPPEGAWPPASKTSGQDDLRTSVERSRDVASTHGEVGAPAMKPGETDSEAKFASKSRTSVQVSSHAKYSAVVNSNSAETRPKALNASRSKGSPSVGTRERTQSSERGGSELADPGGYLDDVLTAPLSQDWFQFEDFLPLTEKERIRRSVDNDIQSGDDCSSSSCGSNENCASVSGGRFCVCNSGFERPASSGGCRDIDECVRNMHNCNEFEVCRNTQGGFTCDCKDNFERNENGECDPLYLYGFSQSDSRVRSADDATTPVTLSLGIPVGEERYQRMYVGTNGIISFGNPYNPYYPRMPFRGRAAVAPFWGDINIHGTSDANIFYQTYDGNVPFLGGRATAVLNRATSDVNQYMRIRNFRARWVLVVTWDKTPPYSYYRYPRSRERITFQCVLATDGDATYAMYFYRKGAFSWSSRVSRRIVVGYTDPRFRFRTLIHSQRSTAYRIDSFIGNTGVRGAYIFKIGYAISYAQSCMNWYYRNSHDYQFQLYQSFMPPCPCSPRRLRWDRRWGRLYYVNRHRCLQMRPQRWLRPYGKECCYLNGQFVSGMPFGGGVQRYHPRYNRRMHRREDVQAKRNCCFRSPYCHLYYALRPSGFCAMMNSFQEAALFGDPHILTLDGKKYTFNGWGEYIMLEIQTANNSFVLQGRTDRAETENGTLSNATIFSAFAAKDSQDASIHVELDRNKTGLVIYANGNDHTASFYANQDFEYETDTLVLSRENDSLAVSFAYSGISVTIHVGVKLLTLTVSMPSSFKGQTRGLLGTFNDNATDDFQMRNGTVLPADASEEEIFTHFGNSWKIRANESVFRYPLRTRAEDFQHDDFKPIFLDQIDPVLVNRSYEVCGGADNIACVYDFVATGNRRLAERSALSSEEASSAQTELANNFPNLTISNTTVHVRVQENVTINLIGEDEDAGDVLTYFTVDAPNGVALDNSSGTVTYRPENMDPTTLRFYAADTHELKSQEVIVSVVLCSGCNNHGSCNYHDTSRNDASNNSNPNFRLAVCDCNVGWTGSDCETDVAGCAENPCLQGQNCTDLSPDEHRAQADANPNATENELGFNCSACPKGYAIVDNKCQDVDECSNNSTNTCDQVCLNTPGAYTCDCHSGYRRVDNACVDIDECLERTAGCEQVCTNNPGNFSCSCKYGYELKADQKSCNQTLDVCERSLLNCTYGCRNSSSGSLECFCPTGFQLHATDGRSCVDMNECELTVSPCSQRCANTNGSYTCSCYAGYELSSDRVNCQPCGDNQYGPNCAHTCECSGRGTDCHRVTGCVCETGWTGESCSEDVDECHDNPNICGTSQSCVNTVGSYECRCPDGYRKDGMNCQDTDECADEDLNTCSQTQTCANSVGSYACPCLSGYQGENCTDIDECATAQSGCQQICDNVPGSFNCRCNWGYELGADRKSCQQIQNVCATLGNLNCTQGCTVDEGSTTPYCFCHEGYQLATDRQTCLDIDECARGDSSCSHICINTMGNYHCSCPAGLSLNADQRTCTPCDGAHWGVGCSNLCNCAVGALRCNKTTGCVCKTGWTGLRCQDDRNECDSSSTCPELATCLNTPGSYRCQCRSGYRLNNVTNTCEDINECSSSSNPCDQNCDNTPGSYVCTCNAGFFWSGTQCQDVDECTSGQDGCQQMCRNTLGSYACYCRLGYTLDAVGKRNCTAETTCVATNCTQVCEVSLEGNARREFCTCSRGYRLSPDNVTCVDINECNVTQPCDQICTNNEGGYRCSCRDGFSLQSDNINCRACTGGTWGPGCQNNCTCNAERSVSCNTTNGHCTCLSGWEGSNCTEDIDECDQASSGFVACPAHSQCNNTRGGYACVCNVGYRKNDSSLCEECDGNHWGLDCANTCTCAQTATACDRVSGACTCQTGYIGTDCSQDIDECAAGSSNCSQNAHRRCRNTVGSFECDCVSGYSLQGDACQDVNECFDPDLNTCEHNCENSQGNFSCSCRTGFTLVNGTRCQDINECMDSTHNCSAREDCQNIDGGFNCTCKYGYERNNTVCTDIDECASNATHNCSRAHEFCVNKDGGFQCDCDTGFFKVIDGCQDTDYCNDTSRCNGENEACRNVVGGFQCYCVAGYRNVSGNCSDINECRESTHDCSAREVCINTIGNFTCECKPGLTRNGTECSDIDECANATLHNCEQLCINGDGNFSCGCWPGYSPWNTTHCEDIDECSNATLNTCQQECTNHMGNFSCGCRSGYSPVNATHCEDIDECANATLHNCDQRCINGDGNFSCGCWPGYSPFNTTHCEDVDECSSATLNTCQQECTNHMGNFSCGCRSGYSPVNATHCEDIDECSNSTLHNCDQRCINQDGNFSCGCWPGYSPFNTTHCEDIDECSSATLNTCQQECTNHMGNFSCGCRSGYSPVNATHCEDIDECGNATLHNCDQRCINQDGNFSCGCLPGYSPFNTTHCEDIDECSSATLNTCQQECTNHMGNFSCGCRSGYNLVNATHCEDANECDNATLHNCEQRCINQDGNFSCGCWTGYTPKNSTHCEDIDECSNATLNTCQQECTNHMGNFSCGCRSGYSPVNATHCEDIDECSSTTLNTCQQECTNHMGNFSCGCRSGYSLVNGTYCEGMYPYGFSGGDLTLPKFDDVTSPAIFLDVGFPIGTKRYSKIFIGSNGIISFGSAYNPYYPRVYGSSASKLIAPFWSDINIYGSTDSNIFYHVYDQNTDTSVATSSVLQRASQDVAGSLGKTGFQALWALVVTWDSAPPYSSVSDSERISFQCVLASNGEESFALFFYKLGSFSWRFKRGRRIIIGTVDVNNQFLSLLHSLKSTAYEMDQMSGNTGERGFWAFQVGKSVSFAQTCRNWYDRNKNDAMIRILASFMPPCPCAPNRLRWDRRWGSFYSRGSYRCLTMRPQRWLRPLGKECCYYNGVFESGMPEAGSVFRYHPWYDRRMHQKEDIRAKQDCCECSSLCSLYYELRPVGDCARLNAWQEAALFGDPHILTLDGRSYTFNGWGEYTLIDIQVANNTFVLQGRTALAVTENGTESNATVFSAFAAKDYQNASFHVELSDDKKSMIIFGNDLDQTTAFSEDNFLYESDILALSRENGSLVVSFASSGISLKIDIGINLLTVAATLPVTFKTSTRGLMGNFNGNKTDDFLLRNGTTLHDDATEEEIFNTFGNDWQINGTESVFRYPVGKTYTDFQHPEFRPIFLDQVANETVQKAYEVCGGSENLACVFDYVATGSRRIATASALSRNATLAAQEDLVKEFPNVTVESSVVHATINSPVQIQLLGSDPDQKSISYFSSDASSSVTLNKDNGSVTYNPRDVQPISLSFYVEDSDGLKSPTVTVAVILCSGCSNHGSCNYSDTSRSDVNNASNPNFRLAVCDCEVGWTGADCESDLDACAGNPCSQGQNCTDLDPAAHQAQATANPNATEDQLGFTCSACPQGFELREGKCKDINECSTGTPCDHLCENTDGSYVCLCRSGYRRTQDRCQDINECGEGTSGCEQTCTNSDGSFTCSCANGYSLQSDNTTCSLTDTGLCGTLTCQYNCRRSGSSVECFCPLGKSLKADGKSCENINECDGNNPCSQTCTDRDPGFRCSCLPGYTLAADHVSCTPCGDNQFGVDCAQSCQCGGRGTGCNPVSGCVCQTGWTGQNCTQDVNECEVNPNICGAEQTCVNTPGSHECTCPTGYTKNSTHCSDIDECDDVDLNNCTQAQTCANSIGSYVCNCRSGYSGANCADIDECATPQSGCAHECHNSPGTFSCSCYNGYRLGTDRKSCVEVAGQNVCGAPALNCTQICTLDEGTSTARCRCRIGYTLDVTDNVTCTDIDECTPGASLCSHTCSNTNGSYTCSCPVGFSLNNDGRVCSECDSSHWGGNCSRQCMCGVGATSCDSVAGCVCRTGYNNTDGSPCQDIDECSLGTHNCSDPATCVNTPGSFSCNCLQGYAYDYTSGACVDVDECESSPCDQTCVNTKGRYYCTCRNGFRLEGTRCKDIDECSTAGVCTKFEECFNTIGGKRCTCNTDLYKLQEGKCYNTKEYTVVIKLTMRFENTNTFRNNIRSLMLTHFRTTISKPDVFIDFVVYSVRNGSTIVNGSLQLNNDTAVAANPDAYAATSLAAAAAGIQGGNGTIAVQSLSLGGIPIELSSAACDVYIRLTPCDPATAVCDASSGLPVCKPIAPTVDSLAMIIGLSVGIPLGLLFVIAVVAIAVYCRVKAKRKTAEETMLRGDNYGYLRQAFGSSIPTRHHGKSKLLYQPDTMSSGSSGESMPGMRNGKGRSDFRDSAWYDNTTGGAGAFRPGPPDEPRSNFSWDFLFGVLSPNEPFSIKRPQVNVQPTGAFPPNGRRPDSLA